jgi:hypothetical protein
MERTVRIRHIAAVAGPLGLVAVLAVSVHAALPPQYDRWTEFTALTAQKSIPEKLGARNPAERIERAADGTYRVYGGTCVVTVRLARKPPTGPQGQPMPGPTAVSVAEVSEPTCR